MEGRLNLDGGTLNLDEGTPKYRWGNAQFRWGDAQAQWGDASPRYPYNLSTGATPPGTPPNGLPQKQFFERLKLGC